MIRSVLTVVAALLMFGATRPASPVSFRLGVIPAAPGSGTLITVEMRLTGDADGETLIRLPDQFGPGRELWRYVSDLKVEGATVAEAGPAARRLTHPPNARLVIRYRVRTAYDREPTAAEGNPYRGPVLRPAWFFALGNSLYVLPAGPERKATVRWASLPEGWQAASTIEDRGATLDELRGSAVIGGVELGIAKRPIPGGVLRVATRGGQAAAEAFADQLVPVVSAQRQFWGDLREPYLVTLVSLAPSPGTRFNGGTGRAGGFVLYSDGQSTSAELLRVIAHEHIHTWVPFRLGDLPLGADEPAGYWFSEGFTEFYTHRTLVRAGLSTPEDFVRDADGVMQNYEASPVRAAPNARIVADFWNDGRVKDLPYQRGYLLALKWDEDIRRATHGQRDLDDVMFAMRDRYLAAAGGLNARDSLLATARKVGGVDLASDLRHYVDLGEIIPLPSQLFGGCLSVATRPDGKRRLLLAALDGPACARAFGGLPTRAPVT